MNNLIEKWKNVLERIKPQMMGASFTSWIEPLKPIHQDDSKMQITLSAQNDFVQSIVSKRYLNMIEKEVRAEYGEKYEIKIITSSDENPTEATSSYSDKNKPNAADSITDSPADSAYDLNNELYLNPRYNFSTFIVGKNNEMAHAAAVAVAKNPSHAYNPLFLYGGAGLGKTHLMHAIGHYVLNEDPGKKVVYVSSEQFTNELINAIQKKTTMEFKKKYRNVDILMIDDIQFIEGKESTQQEVFYTFNTLYEANKQIILTSDRPPKELQTLEPRLKSRFEWGLLADIKPPDFETRVAILRTKAAVENIEVTNEINNVFYQIAESITTNIRELEGAFTRVIAFSNLKNVPITTELANSVLKEAFEINRFSIDPPLIKRKVCDYYGISIEDIESPKRSKDIAFARHVAMYLCRELTELSLPKIGENFGGRDHTTVIHSYDKITNMIKNDSDFGDVIHNLIEEIREK